jgi:hypothetical protein
MCKNFNTLQLKNPESESGQKNKGRYIWNYTTYILSLIYR